MGGLVSAGDKAPAFALPTADGSIVRLKDFAGRPVVVYFYPKDNTSGCTQQACDFRDAAPRFADIDAVVLGISPDSASSHAKFAAKFGLPFQLLVDADHEVAEKYGAWAEKSMYGRKYFGIERSTFVIDGAGRIAAAWRKVKVPGHVAEVLATLKGASPAAKPTAKAASRRSARDGAAKASGAAAKKKASRGKQGARRK
ncbi:MAG: thioredoxin-dependent thiol peroxidase [Planctomyces sp.]|nr:thioredoxin-dependent thiol peroxidase [Planctomyces sp.]